MINSITGRFTGRKGSLLFLMLGGVEWSLISTEGAIIYASSVKTDVKIYTYLHHREDQMQLYGFQNIREREIFLELIKVSGIGPKQAMRMLSGIGTEELVTALDAGDTDRLSLLPGIGKKTAAKIVLSLRGKLKLDSDDKEIDAFPELVEALVGMGFDKRQARKALSEVSGRPELSSLSGEILEKQLFREAIVFLSS